MANCKVLSVVEVLVPGNPETVRRQCKCQYVVSEGGFTQFAEDGADQDVRRQCFHLDFGLEIV